VTSAWCNPRLDWVVSTAWPPEDIPNAGWDSPLSVNSVCSREGGHMLISTKGQTWALLLQGRPCRRWHQTKATSGADRPV
jgi:hypothetical protein